MTRQKTTLLLVVAVLLSSCSTSGKLSPEKTGASSPISPTMTSMIVVSPESSNIPLTPATAFATPTLSLTNLSGSGWVTHCLDVATNLPSKLRGEGNIILQQKQGAEHSFFVNMESGIKEPLPDNWHSWDWDVSPNGQWLTYFQEHIDQSGVMTSTNLQIMDSDGKVQAIIPLDDLYEGWLDNERLYFRHRIKPNEKAFSLIALNPFTGQRQELLPDYPDIFPNLNYYDRTRYYPIEVYNPFLTLVAYPYIAENQTEVGWRLLDIKNKQILASIPALIFRAGPVWSFDGDRFVVIGLTSFSSDEYAELFEVSHNGQVTQLTNIGASGGYISNNSYRWSPDERYIAFWMHTSQHQEENVDQLAVLDVNSNEVVNYCIPGRKLVGAEAPIWSPDSQQLAVASYDKDRNPSVIVVDIKQEIAAQLGKNLEPAFWLKILPPVWMKTP